MTPQPDECLAAPRREGRNPASAEGNAMTVNPEMKRSRRNELVGPKSLTRSQNSFQMVREWGKAL